MPYKSPQAVHIDEMLTEISVGYQNAEFVGEALAPVVRVSKQSDRYYVHTRREGWSAYDDLRAPGARANELPAIVLSRDSYYTEEHALVGLVYPEDDEQADAGLDPEADVTEQVTESVLMGREKAIADLATTAANYPAGHTVTLSGTDQWNDYTNSDPKDDVKTGREVVFAAIQKVPNTAIMGRQVFTQLEDHPDVIERIKYSQPGFTTAQIIAEWLGVGRLIVGSAMRDSANPGASAATLGFMWGKDVLLAYVPPRAGRRVPAFMYEFVKPTNGQVMTTERWFDIDHKVDKVRVTRSYDLKFIAQDANGKAIAGYLIKAAVA